jgi:hypothetical protein
MLFPSMAGSNHQLRQHQVLLLAFASMTAMSETLHLRQCFDLALKQNTDISVFRRKLNRQRVMIPLSYFLWKQRHAESLELNIR